jgi:S1-C subfamily serine protease
MAKQYGWTDETKASKSGVDFHTDLGNARRFVERHGQDIRFVYDWRKWITWDGHRWNVDNDGAAVRLAKETVTAMFSEALQVPDESKRTNLMRHALKSQSEPRLDAMISLAESEMEVVLSAKILDADAWLLGVQNGAVDLKTGVFRPGRREDLITKQAGACYDPNAHCPEWLKFLDTVTGGDKELQSYLQRATGYALTGFVCEEVAFVLHGTGSNGKSTFRETLHALFGDYALAADAGLLTERKIQAYMWYNLAVSQVPTSDRDFVNSLRNRLTAKMTSAQVAEGQRMSEHCLRSNYTDCESPRVARREDKDAPRNEVASTGTGFFVSEAGHIVTNAHVVEGCKTVRSALQGTLRRVSVDEESDLALYIASEKTDAIARLHGGRGARAGESVVAVGFPLSGLLSSDPIVTTGIISALSGLRNDRRTIQITAPVQPGSSGGPVLGENGSVVGVVVSKLNAIKVAEAIGDIPQNVNFAVSLGTLQSFLNANRVPYALDDSKATKTPADITADATRYTMLLECLR